VKYIPNGNYIFQPKPDGENNGKIFKVSFKDGTESPLLSREDAEYVLEQSNKLSVRAQVRNSIQSN